MEVMDRLDELLEIPIRLLISVTGTGRNINLSGMTVQNNLNALVEKGRLTQEQADEYLNWIQSRPEGIPAMRKQFFGKMGHHKGWKGHDRFFGSRNYFKGELSLEDV